MEMSAMSIDNTGSRRDEQGQSRPVTPTPDVGTMLSNAKEIIQSTRMKTGKIGNEVVRW
jgi:hypothetical protein